MTNSWKDDYEFLTVVSYALGLIDVFIYQERLDFLEEDEEAEFSPEDNQDLVEVEKRHPSGHRDGRDPILSLITPNVGVLGAKWVFTLGDPDPFPSIPHGHLHSKKYVKLDAYLGYTFDMRNGQKQLKRESRVFIVNLWNNQKFRQFARKQLRWFISQNPNFKWRVSYPLRLPNRRP